MEPLVSIIVSVYNGENYIGNCIDSILNNSLKDIEIIIINDGSKDNTEKIIGDYAKKDLRVKAINQKNSGPAVARNNGIKVANGKYIGFVDSDDTIEKNMYEELFNLADKNNIQVSMCGYKEINLKSKDILKVNTVLEDNKIYNKDEIKDNIIKTFTKSDNYGFFCLWNKIYLREWLLETKIIMDENRFHGEDWLFNINVFLSLESFICTNKALYNYIHVNSDSLMFKYRENQFDLFLDGRKKLISSIPVECLDIDELDKRFFYEFSSYIIRTFKEVNDKNLRKKLIKNVLNNDEVKSVCNKDLTLPIHFRLISNIIKYRLNWIAYNSYKTISLLK